MTTSPYQQSDYKTNVDQTDRHLHVTNGSEILKTEEQSNNTFEIKDLLYNILLEQRLTNKYLSEFLEDSFKENEL
jgi:hypothetical protein